MPVTTRRARTAASLAAVVGLAVVLPSPQASAAELVVRSADAVGDVELITDFGPKTSQRRSIDLREMKVVNRGDEVRFVVQVRRVTTSKTFDQMAFVSVRPPAGSPSTWKVDIGLSPQLPDLSYAYLFLDDTGTRLRTCDPLVATVLWGREAVRLDVPLKCIPHEAGRIKVKTITGHFRSDAGGPYSKDVLRIPGEYELR